jgi:hypothetical protein
MDWKITLMEDVGIIRVALCGDFAVDRYEPMLDELTSRKDFLPGVPILVDDREMNVAGVRAQEIERCSQIFASFGEKLGAARFAILANSVVQFGLARQFQSLAEAKGASPPHVFTNETDAVEWLLARRH